MRVPALLAIVLLFGTLIAGCGGGEEAAGGDGEGRQPEQVAETTQAPPPEPPPEEPGGEGRAPVVVRLSGSPGTVYAGNLGNLENSEYQEGVLEGETLQWEVPVRDSGFDVVEASFVKPRARGTLAVEILVDGEVVNQSETSAQYGAVNISWSFGG